MKKVQCPCCGNYTFEDYEHAIFEFCEVCAWQYDETAHEPSSKISGANKMSLNEAREIFANYGVSDLRMTQPRRAPYDYELPENNKF